MLIVWIRSVNNVRFDPTHNKVSSASSFNASSKTCIVRNGVSIKSCVSPLLLTRCSKSFSLRIRSFLSFGKYPWKENCWPLNPLPISVSKMELGPTVGQTWILFSCANATKTPPGSAIPAQPASLMMPIFFPFREKLILLHILILSHIYQGEKPLHGSDVIYITIYGHTFFIYIIYHGNKAVCISWIDAKKLAHNSCKPVQDCYVNNNINLAQNRPKIMGKTSSPPKTYLCPKSCSNCSCRLSCKNWIFCSCELMTHQLQKLHT